MALRSKLLRGDPRLEACLLSDSAHIMRKAAGPHVAKIQKALGVVGKVSIDKGEIDSETYGDSTAAAVHTFKKQNNIINYTYQSQADDIVGKMTLRALDDLMLKHEQQVIPPDIPPIAGFAGILIGPLGERGHIVTDYYRNCGLETIGDGQIMTFGVQSYSTFEDLLDLLLARPERHHVIVNHGNQAFGLLVPFSRGSRFNATGMVVGHLSLLADRAEKEDLDPSSFGVLEVSGLMGVTPVTTVRIVGKLVQLRKKKLTLHFRACRIGGNRGMVLDYRDAFGALLISYHSSRLLYLQIKPAQMKPGHSPAEFNEDKNTAKARLRRFEDVLGLLSTLIIEIDDIDGHTRVEPIAVIERLGSGQIEGWARYLVRQWLQRDPVEFVLPVMWENSERTYHCPLELGWRKKLQYVHL